MARDDNSRMEAIGVARVQLAVVEALGWVFRSQTDQDNGIDAHAEVDDGEDVTGRLLALQIKAGPSWFRRPGPGGWWYYASERHARYWNGYSLPVVIVLYDPETKRGYWELVNDDTVVPTSSGGKKVLVPQTQVLDEFSRDALQAIAENRPVPRLDRETQQIVAMLPVRPHLVQVRRNQAEFRRALLYRYGSACAVTGPCPPELLMVAHLVPLADGGSDATDNRVLLRADVHKMFDVGLLTVDPDTWKAVLSPAIRDNPHYAAFDGVTFVKGPALEAVRQHFQRATASWA
ncbi:DUF4365 domain-containing protein [Lentzea sp. NPDC051838]|uniref:DUF4365 domain-containing protein n=1 Tax=Lentzea sp. NPDC051838 TaxID=3154849 RepID=UPI003444DE14